ncbi:hypothetical protein [Jannaschia sp. LMIT008]|uniref:hypothetical protein n=1 Tax=Jannaschia maritima TaxID=3032585 RepID=UPI00281246C5|nr:hypothetical protein [Jannaschia sp. LMIT008]
MRHLPLILLLSACLPHPVDRLTTSGRGEANGHRYTVHWNADTAQATRTNVVWLPSFTSVATGAIEVTERLTGCRVREGSLDGDVALVEMALDC